MKAQGEMNAEHSETLAQLSMVNINRLQIHAKRNEEDQTQEQQKITKYALSVSAIDK